MLQSHRDYDYGQMLEELYEDSGEVTQEEFEEIAVQTSTYGEMVNWYIEEVDEYVLENGSMPNWNEPEISYHQRFGWNYTAGGDAHRLWELAQSEDGRIQLGRAALDMGSHIVTREEVLGGLVRDWLINPISGETQIIENVRKAPTQPEVGDAYIFDHVAWWECPAVRYTSVAVVDGFKVVSIGDYSE